MNTQESSNSRGVRVEVRGLKRTFGQQPVLKDLSFTVDRGEVFAVMGPSGSGKSVLLKHLIGLEQPDAGEILIEGEPVLTAGVMDRYRMAMVFQSGALLNSLTVAENVGLYLAEHRLKKSAEIARIVEEKLKLVNLAGQEDRYPAELSGGMKKRVAIARALVIEPRLLLYDEPTSELDPQMAVVIAEEICSLNRRTGVTSIVVSHDRDLAFGIADRIALIHRGEILTIGAPEDLRRCSDRRVQEFLTVSFNQHRERKQ
jgi:phospholipid/cholesterol/gamma-HCH transport system ATP-binding protein